MPTKILDKWCRGCKRCVGACPNEAIYTQGLAVIVDSEKCTECKNCLDACMHGAISFVPNS